MADNTHDSENMTDGSSVNCDKRVHHTAAENNRIAHLPVHHETSQMCRIREEPETSTIPRQRGKHCLPDLEPHSMINFAPRPRREHSIQRPLSPSVNSGSNPQDDNAEEKFHAAKRFELQISERKDSQSH